MGHYRWRWNPSRFVHVSGANPDLRKAWYRCSCDEGVDHEDKS